MTCEVAQQSTRDQEPLPDIPITPSLDDAHPVRSLISVGGSLSHIMILGNSFEAPQTKKSHDYTVPGIRLIIVLASATER